MLPLLLACVTDCPSFAEMEVTDPDGVATPDQVDVVRTTIERFADLTGREGVCVPEVRFRPDDWGETQDVWGQYRGHGAATFVSAGSTDLEGTTRHELCHALDHEEGISEANTDLFPAEAVERDSHYPTTELREHEAFARECEVGMGGIEREIADACGLDPREGIGEFLRDEVYRNAPGLRRLPVTIDRHPVEEVPIDHAPAAGTDGATALLLRDYGLDDSPAVFRIDPITGAIDASLDLPVDPDDHDVRWSILAGSGTAIVIEARATSTAWQVDFEQGIATRLDGFPTSTDWNELYGTITGDSVWLTDAGNVHGTPKLRRYDRARGLTETIAWPDDRLTQAFSWGATDRQLVGLDVEGRLLILDLSAGTWETVEPPEDLALRDLALDGDRVVLSAYAREDGDGSAEWADYLIFYDLATREWMLPEDPCGVAATGSPFPMTMATGVWLLDQGAARDDHRRYVGRLSMGG